MEPDLGHAASVYGMPLYPVSMSKTCLIFHFLDLNVLTLCYYGVKEVLSFSINSKCWKMDSMYLTVLNQNLFVPLIVKN